MLKEKNFLNLLYLGSRHKRVARAQPYVPLDLVANMPGYGEKRTARKTRDLIKLLLSHGARAARSSQPRAHVAINVVSPNGQKAVRIKMAR
jgi:hypothetical protein